jgi:hypothetical protein
MDICADTETEILLTNFSDDHEHEKFKTFGDETCGPTDNTCYLL